MAYYSNLEKIIEEKQKQNKQKKFNSKTCAIVLTVVATIGYFSLFTNLVGFLKHFLLGFFGIFAYAIFTTLFVISGMLLKGKKYAMTKKYFLALVFALFSILAIFHMAFSGGVDFSSYGAYLSNIYNMQVSVGGLLFGLIIYPFHKFLNVGAYVLFSIVLVVCVTIIYNGIAEAKSLAKIDFNIFKKKNSQANHALAGQTLQEKTTEKVNQARVYQNNEYINKQFSQNTQTDSQMNAQQYSSLQNENNEQSVGLNAEIKREKTAKEIALEKLGLLNPDERNVHLDSNANQLDTFVTNYMNGGGSVFATKNYVRPNVSSSNLSGTFGYSTIIENERRERQKQIDAEKYNDYKTFMGITDDNSLNDVFRPSHVSNFDDYSKHESTETNDEKLFGAPKNEYSPEQDYKNESYSSQANQSDAANYFTENTNKNTIEFDYSNNFEKDEQNSFMDKLDSEKQNEEIVPENATETEIHEEKDLFEIFSSPVPKKSKPELPKSFQNDNYAIKKFDVSSKNPIDNEIYKQKEFEKPVVNDIEEEKPKIQIPKYKYTKPTLDLLSTQSTDPSTYGGNIEETSHKIESVLEDFKIPAKVVGITRGPAVTRYELAMPPGISVSKIFSYENDIAMRIATSKRIRILAPIPGMSAFGIEVPNDKVATVSLKEVLASESFILSKSPCSFALGKEINGVIDVCAVNKMPHVLVAGSTGSGKSVCLNSLILSILFKSSPEDVKFILIDPKRVEFSVYSGLPHLIVPDIISEPKKADNALAWAVKEMEKRYDALAEHRVRNIDEYNNMQEVKDRWLPKMPYIIIIMDEFADIMQSPDCKDIEGKVQKLAAKARAAGIHLVLATQRPSVDVLSGTAKNNFPARIAFFLTSQTDSRTILGFGGAETLLGRGDMLYVAPGSNSDPKRLQGCYVSDDEVKSVVDFVIKNNEPEFDEKIEAEFNRTRAGDSVNPDGTFASYDNDGHDEEAEMEGYAREVMKEFIRVGRASASYIQRTMRVGFNKAGRIIDYLAKKKYISPGDGSAKARAVYMTKQQYIEIFGDTDFDNHD